MTKYLFIAALHSLIWTSLSFAGGDSSGINTTTHFVCKPSYGFKGNATRLTLITNFSQSTGKMQTSRLILSYGVHTSTNNVYTSMDRSIYYNFPLPGPSSLNEVVGNITGAGYTYAPVGFHTESDVEFRIQFESGVADHVRVQAVAKRKTDGSTVQVSGLLVCRKGK